MSEVSAGVIPDEQDSVPQSGLKSPTPLLSIAGCANRCCTSY